MEEAKLKVTETLFVYGDLSVLRIGDTFYTRRGNDLVIEIKRVVVRTSLLPSVKTPDEWHALGEIYFGTGDNSIKLDLLDDDNFVFIVKWVTEKSTVMPKDVAAALLAFLVSEDGLVRPFH